MNDKSKMGLGSKCVSIGALLSLAALLPGCGADVMTDGAVGEAQQAVLPGDYSGWAFFDGFNHDSSRSFNSTGGLTSITPSGLGTYVVSFAGLGAGDSGGNVQVTALGTTPSRCKAVNFSSFQTSFLVNVRCDRQGAPASSAFLVSYARFAGGSAVQADGAYLTSTSLGGGVEASTQWGAASSVQRVELGVYEARFPGQISQDVGVIVSAVGNNSRYCNVGNWYGTGTETVVVVRCFAQGGSSADSRFSLRLAREMRDTSGRSGGYAWANDETALSYTPPLAWQQNHAVTSCGVISSDNTVVRTGTGAYTVTYPTLHGKGAAAFATAFGTESDYCKSSSWTDIPVTDKAKVQVRCFDAQGEPINSQYTSVLFSQWVLQC